MRHPDGLLTAGVLLLALFCPSSHASATTARPAAGADPSRIGDPGTPGPGEPGAIRVTIETIIVDGRGTHSLGSEIADIFPGDTGVMRRSATLLSREEGSPVKEMVDLHVRLTPAPRPDGGCELRLESRVAMAAAGTRSARARAPAAAVASVVVAAGRERLHPVYESSLTGGRVALRIRCAPSPSASEIPGNPRVDFVLSIERADAEEPLQTLKTNVLSTGVGREASNLFSFNVPLPPQEDGGKRYRRERIEIRIAPELFSGGRLQANIRMDGEIASISALDPAVSHPIEYRGTAVLGAGEPHSIDLAVSSVDASEGWSLVRYRVRIVSRFVAP